MRGTLFRSTYFRLNTFYLVKDPWNLGDAKEAERFAKTNLAVRKFFGSPVKVLEVGCGEGTQSRVISQLGTEVTGIDVSARAIARAKQRVPQGRFFVGYGERLDEQFAGERFDAALACEVLYYASDPAAVIAAMQNLTDQILVTVYEPFFAQLEAVFESAGWSDAGVIDSMHLRWQCRIWRKADEARQ